MLRGTLDQVSMIITGIGKSELAHTHAPLPHGAVLRQQLIFRSTGSTFIHFFGANSQGSSEYTQPATEKKGMVEFTSMTFR